MHDLGLARSTRLRSPLRTPRGRSLLVPSSCYRSFKAWRCTIMGCWEVQSYSWTREGPSLGAGVPMGLIRNSSLPASAFQSKTLDAMGVTAYFHVDRNVVLSGIVGSLRRALDHLACVSLLTRLPWVGLDRRVDRRCREARAAHLRGATRQVQHAAGSRARPKERDLHRQRDAGRCGRRCCHGLDHRAAPRLRELQQRSGGP